MSAAATDIGLREVGLIQAFESGVRCSISIIFRLLMGYLVGLPVTALAVNATVAYGLTAILELPAGIFADRFGAWRAVKLGYLAQTGAALALFAGLMAWPTNPIWMWIGIVAEGVLDACGNALLSGAREVVLKDVVGIAYDRAGGNDATMRATVERDFLARSEAYGRIFLLVMPGFYLGLTLLLHSQGLQVAWVLLGLAVGWLFLLVRMTRLVRSYGLANQPRAIAKSWRQIVVSALRSIGGFSPKVRTSAAAYVAFTFAFGVIHGYLILGLLREPGSWFAGQLWLAVVVANFAFIAGRLGRSFILPGLMRRLPIQRVTLIGCIAAVILVNVFWLIHLTQAPAVTAIALLVFASAFDNAIGLATRPALGEVLAAADPQAAASVLSMLSQASTVFGALYAVWLTTSGRGVPSVEACAVTVTLAALGVAMLNVRAKQRGAING